MMQNIYKETQVLDKRAIDRFLLSEEILVENASVALKNQLEKITHKQSLVYIICGGGNNGADGLALARKVNGDYRIKVYMASEPKTTLCEKEFFRAKNSGVEFVTKLYPADVVVDCLIGSGFRGELRGESAELIRAMNKMAGKRLACDIPSGVGKGFKGVAFEAHWTICMGALKMGLFCEWAKDYVGEIIVADLGVSRKNYEITSNAKLLDKQDLILPLRHKQDTHKGEYGHLSILCQKNQDSKSGAGILSALSALSFGVGLVTLVSPQGELNHVPYEVMQSVNIPENSNVVAFGMGAGEIGDLRMCEGRFCVLDADVFKSNVVKEFLDNAKAQSELSKVVLTPHIKEFANLLRICCIADLSVEEVKNNRDALIGEFCAMYPQVVVVLKGANTLIAQNEKIFVCNLGGNNLAKGGSGDVLVGMIGALIAQRREPLRASIDAVLAHAIAANQIKTSYGLTPMDLIERVKNL